MRLDVSERVTLDLIVVYGGAYEARPTTLLLLLHGGFLVLNLQ